MPSSRSARTNRASGGSSRAAATVRPASRSGSSRTTPARLRTALETFPDAATREDIFFIHAVSLRRPAPSRKPLFRTMTAKHRSSRSEPPLGSANIFAGRGLCPADPSAGARSGAFCRDRRIQPLTPEAMSLSTRRRWAQKKARTQGIMVSTEAAMSRLALVEPYWPVRLACEMPRVYWRAELR